MDRSGGSLEYAPWDIAKTVWGEPPTGLQTGGITRTLGTLQQLGLDFLTYTAGSLGRCIRCPWYAPSSFWSGPSSANRPAATSTL